MRDEKREAAARGLSAPTGKGRGQGELTASRSLLSFRFGKACKSPTSGSRHFSAPRGKGESGWRGKKKKSSSELDRGSSGPREVLLESLLARPYGSLSSGLKKDECRESKSDVWSRKRTSGSQCGGCACFPRDSSRKPVGAVTGFFVFFHR